MGNSGENQQRNRLEESLQSSAFEEFLIEKEDPKDYLGQKKC
jgi:hypothetical protein